MTLYLTRMHSSRMRTARSLTVSGRILRTPPPQQPHMPPATMHPPITMHTPHNHACMPPCSHAPLATTPPPSNHACPPTTTHAPRQPRTPPRLPCCGPVATDSSKRKSTTSCLFINRNVRETASSRTSIRFINYTKNEKVSIHALFIVRNVQYVEINPKDVL